MNVDNDAEVPVRRGSHGCPGVCKCVSDKLVKTAESAGNPGH